MEYLTAAEISQKWSVSSRMAAYYCETGRIAGAVKKGKVWLIPADAEKPADRRYSTKAVESAVDRETGGEPYSISEAEQEGIAAIYHTGDVYHHLGLTRETLRYYEDIGLIKPKRGRYSQYREFDFFDMSHLMAIDFYRKRGFTPVEIKSIMKAAETAEYDEIMGEQLEKLQYNIDCLQEMRNRLEATREFYRYASDRPMQFVIKELPRYYVRESIPSVASFGEYRDKVLNYLNLENEDILSNVVRAISFDEKGFTGSEMYIVKQSAGTDGNGVCLGGRQCLYTTLVADNNDNSVMEKMFTVCRDWAVQHNVSFRGVAYIFIRFIMLQEQTDRNLYEIWIPLK